MHQSDSNVQIAVVLEFGRTNAKESYTLKVINIEMKTKRDQAAVSDQSG